MNIVWPVGRFGRALKCLQEVLTMMKVFVESIHFDGTMLYIEWDMHKVFILFLFYIFSKWIHLIYLSIFGIASQIVEHWQPHCQWCNCEEYGCKRPLYIIVGTYCNYCMAVFCYNTIECIHKYVWIFFLSIQDQMWRAKWIRMSFKGLILDGCVLLTSTPESLLSHHAERWQFMKFMLRKISNYYMGIFLPNTHNDHHIITPMGLSW